MNADRAARMPNKALSEARMPNKALSEVASLDSMISVPETNTSVRGRGSSRHGRGGSDTWQNDRYDGGGRGGRSRSPGRGRGMPDADRDTSRDWMVPRQSRYFDHDEREDMDDRRKTFVRMERQTRRREGRDDANRSRSRSRSRSASRDALLGKIEIVSKAEGEEEADVPDDGPEDTMHADQETEREKNQRKRLAASQKREDKWAHDSYKDNDRSPSPDQRDTNRKGGKGKGGRSWDDDRGDRFGKGGDRGGKGGRHNDGRGRGRDRDRDISDDRYQPSEIVV